MEYIYSGDENFSRSLRSRVFWITLFVFAAFLTLVIRLWYLQVVQGSSLRALSESNRLRQITLSDQRGRIYDRNGIELVSSRASFNVTLRREDIPDLDELLDRLAKLITFDREKAKTKILSIPAFSPYVLAYDIERDEAARIEERRYELPGVLLEIVPIRNYRHGSFAAHLLGYLSEISKKQLQQAFFDGYRQGDIIGVYGIEKSFEPILHGKRGRKIVEVDAAGRELEVVSSMPSVSGHDLYLSIDHRTQVTAEKAMSGRRGAVVAIKPNTGEILAMVSEPAFNPNQFAVGVERGYWNTLVGDEYHPLNNRAIQGLYAPGSTYKIIVAAAALEEGVIDENTTFFCPGYYKLGRRLYRCWRRGGHGKVNLHKALAESCDVYFYQAGFKTGVDRIAETAKRFGLDGISGINLEHEKDGLVPTTTWKENNRNEPWIAGETLSISIGQGFNLATPLQMARVIAAIASDGWMANPRLIRLENDYEMDRLYLGGHLVGTSQEHLELIREGLLSAVNERKGTGWRARIRGVKVAGKTGTTQVVRLKVTEKLKPEETPEKLRDHAWFVGFAPYEKPEIAVAVVVEHGGSGGVVAAPIVRKVIKAYLKSLAENEGRMAAAAGAR
jgi:penicillin-binding protein 2